MIKKSLRWLRDAFRTMWKRNGRKRSTNYPRFFLHELGAPKCLLRRADRLHLGDNVVLNNAFLDLHDHIWIGDHTFFGHGVAVLTGSHDVYLFGNERQTAIKSNPVRLGAGVWIASFSIILPGTEIGANTVVDAGSVVRGKIPPNVIVAGNPARIVKRLATSDRIENELDIDSKNLDEVIR